MAYWIQEGPQRFTAYCDPCTRALLERGWIFEAQIMAHGDDDLAAAESARCPGCGTVWRQEGVKAAKAS
ncbi:MAG: hypothetical protein KM310_00645 [Clostridiales bacterium]|nr:hypothetical protein [Clostridiales bacterium]